MTGRARRGLENFLSRRAAPARELRDRIDLPDGPLPLLVRTHSTARRMTLRLSPDGGEARVTVPLGVPLSEGAAFARSRVTWLSGQRRAVPAARTVKSGEIVAFRGQDITIAWDAAHPRTPRIAGEELRLGGPAESLASRIQRWMEAQALELCRDDLAHYCARAGVTPPGIRLSRAQRRWGSCSSEGTVRINWRLIMAPDAVRRSVVAHEVAHLVHFDHSPAFYTLLEGIFDDDLRAADRWLKRHGRGLYAAFG